MIKGDARSLDPKPKTSRGMLGVWDARSSDLKPYTLNPILEVFEGDARSLDFKP